jgi:phenylacetate-CoA ligase
MQIIRGLTVFPSAVEEVVRRIDELGDEFEIVNLDCFRIVGEPRAEVPTSRHAALAEKIESEVHAKIGLRPEVELMVWTPPPQMAFDMPHGKRGDLQSATEGERP